MPTIKPSDKRDGNEIENETPVFVIGSARSGTSILARLIRDYLRISFGTESQFIVRFFNKLDQYGNLNDEKNLARLIGDIGEERCFKRWGKFGYAFESERIIQRTKERSYPGVLTAIFSDLADHNEMTRWGDKTPEYIYDLDIMYQLFPGAKFVHIVRDGRDVALSTFRMHFGAKNIGIAALQWHRQMDCVSAFKKIVNRDQFIELKYEEFLDNPIDTFFKLMDFLCVKDGSGLIVKSIHEKIESEIMKGNYYKWKRMLNKKQIQTFDRINHQFLLEHGYEVSQKQSKMPGALEKLAWTIDHRIKQFGRLDTWADNFYKARVRLNEVIRKL